APDQRRRPDLGKKRALPEYVVEPPDLLDVDVRGDLSGRPIHGERLVRPDGKISLGFYGELYVAGLTTPEIKEKLIRHLRQFLSEESLGLKEGQQKDVVEVAPRASELVTVTVLSFNSKGYYVQGEVAKPGRYPATGNETVSDAINQAGGLRATPETLRVQLVRPAPPGACCEETFPVDLTAISRKGDPLTNYPLMPGDRLMVVRNAKESGGRAKRSRREIEAQIDAIIGQLETLKSEIAEEDSLP
ncbi:polysaccharide biosynthesis/export family protein, partial [Singulisphaera rosea]